VLFAAAARHVQLDRFTPDVVLERKVREAVSGGESLSGFVGSVASPSPTPGGGSVAAHAGALGAALAQMVAGLTIGKKKYASVDAEMREIAVAAADLGNRLSALVQRDAQSYTAVAEAYKMPKEPADAAAARAKAIEAALLGASEVPLETARACAEVAELAERTARLGNTNAVSDAGVGALLAEAACKGAAYNVRINVVALENPSAGRHLAEEASKIVERASKHAAAAVALVEKALGAG
jgi:glutamate formiminotransferase/formiminotetrahydrofolate cyclodeaminase